ncbi:Serpin-ZX [Capsicum annuum]|nr:Serpin-ZX [Capsicum annuum]KAF3648708.1 Serpin-ZX [Capsicum annuum]
MPSFKKIVKKVYKAASKSVDFQNEAAEVSNQVNRWAKKKTNGLIEEIFPPGIVDEMTRLMFANAENGVRSLMLQKPKTMNFISSMEASNVLEGLGLTLPFSPGGFTKMVDSTLAKYLCVSEIFHKSFIEVNEEGTEAAAVTASRFKLTGSARIIEKPIDFVADHPFLFLIRDESTGVVVIIGSLLNPLAG